MQSEDELCKEKYPGTYYNQSSKLCEHYPMTTIPTTTIPTTTTPTPTPIPILTTITTVATIQPVYQPKPTVTITASSDGSCPPGECWVNGYYRKLGYMFTDIAGDVKVYENAITAFNRHHASTFRAVLPANCSP